MKAVRIKDIAMGKKIESTFMIKKILSKEGNNVLIYMGDITGDIKALVPDPKSLLKVGNVIKVIGVLSSLFEASFCSKISEYNIEDYIPTVKRPIEDIMRELDDLSKEEFKSIECITMNDYFFKNQAFLNKFKKAIGGVSQHHNYIGGLAEHTLNVMYLSKVLAHRYNCRNKEIAILAAKLHDIGKIEEMYYDGPFSYTLRGDMEGHIVIGITMLEEAFKVNPDLYTEDFKLRLKGCVIQHHGKPEFGSPKAPNSEEAYIVHYADYIDATMNKIEIIKKDVPPNNWSAYDRRIEGRIYV